MPFSPSCTGRRAKDGTVQGLLEMLELPYVGSGVRGSAIAMDKPLAKAIFRRAGLPVAQDILVSASMPVPEAAERVRAAFGTRVVIKPASLGSAIGVIRLADGGDLVQSLDAALEFGDALVEPFIAGREMTGGVLDLHGQTARAFPVIEIRTAPGRMVRRRKPLQGRRQRAPDTRALAGARDSRSTEHRHGGTRSARTQGPVTGRLPSSATTMRSPCSRSTPCPA